MYPNRNKYIPIPIPIKNALLSDKTQIFLTLSDHKGIIYTWKKIVLESDHYKWSKMAIEVGRFS